METIRGKHYKDQDIKLDGRNFENCTFDRCRLIYSGKGDVGFNGNSIGATQFVFEGVAANAVSFLQGIANDPNLAPLLADVFPNLVFRGGPTTH